MKKTIVVLSLSFYAMTCFAQETLGKKIDDLTFEWDTKSIGLNSYEGLGKFCDEKEYRDEFVVLLNDIHHYDSVLYQRLLKASRRSHDKDIKKAIKEIEEFEKEYNMKKFIHFLHQECNDRNDIEKHAEDLKSEIGSESYGGQIYLIENELNKYIKHITTRVDHIRKHVHHLHVK
ncbi:MAG: hypothetical protein JXR03_05180 [Cyclobacteriaceae bacterium]